MNQHDTPAKVASADGLGPLVADALTAADEYAEAAGHAECWTGTCASYNQHLADARTKVHRAINAAVASERERLTAACNAYAVRLRAMPPAKLPTPVEVANDLRDLAQGLGPNV